MPRTKSTGEINTRRYNLSMKPAFRRSLEDFSERRDEEISEVLRSGAEFYMNGLLPVLGRIPCGPLAPAIESTPWFEIAPPMLRPRADLGDYFLEADGDSMSPKIEDGDLVMLRPGVDWSNGEVCAVQVFHDKNLEGDCEATLKRFFWEPGRQQATLKAINPEYKDITVPAECVKVVGVFRGLLRRDG